MTDERREIIEKLEKLAKSMIKMSPDGKNIHVGPLTHDELIEFIESLKREGD